MKTMHSVQLKPLKLLNFFAYTTLCYHELLISYEQSVN